MQAQTQPNIVFILTDQMRADCLSIEGHPVVETPNLDMLAAKGTLFQRCYTPGPSCLPARISLFTGLEPYEHGRFSVVENVDWDFKDTLAERLRDGGYQTACIGKTHFAPQRRHLGFEILEHYEGGDKRFSQGYLNDYHEWLRDKSGNTFDEMGSGLDWNSWVARPSHIPEELHNNTWVATRGLEFLKRRDPTRPFFLNLSFQRPHPPIDPPQAYWDMYADREVPEAPVGDWAAVNDVPVTDINAAKGRLPKRQLDNFRRGYFAQIAHIDNQIGRVINKMKRLKITGPTWFVFSADHGEMLGDHHLFRKSLAFEGSARLPLIITPPAGSEVKTTKKACSQIDFMPTMLDIAGLSVPEHIKGRSMLPLMQDEHTEWRPFIHGEHAPHLEFLCDGHEKYIWNCGNGHEFLFDLDKDPQELSNLAEDGTQQSRLEGWRERLVGVLGAREECSFVKGGRLQTGNKLPGLLESRVK